MKILKCISKNLKVLVRSRLASFVIVLAPMVIFLLLEIALNVPEQFSLEIGVYSEKYSQISESIIQEMQDNNLRITRSSSKEECIANVQGGLFSTCIVFPATMSLGSKEDSITIFVDTSKNNIVWAIKDILKNKIERESTRLSSNMTVEIINHVKMVQEKTEARQADTKSSLKSMENAKKETVKLLSNQKKMNFSINQSIFNPDAMISDLKLVKTFANNAMIKSKSLANSIASQFDAVEDKTAVYITNATARDKLLSLINDTKSSLKSTALTIKDNSNSTNENTLKLRDRLENYKIAYESLYKNIQSNSALRADTVTQLVSISREINSTLLELLRIDTSLADFHRSFDSIEILEAKEIVEPFDIVLESITPTKSQMSLIFPMFLAVIILFVSIIIPTMMSVNDKRSHAGTRERLTPVFRVVYIMGIYLTNLLIMFIQVILTVILTRLVLDINVLPNIVPIILSILLSGSAFIMVGIFLGQVFNEEHNALIAAVSIASLLLFMSGVIIPIEAMPPQFYHANLYNPFVITISLLRQEIFYSIPLLQLLPQMLYLLLFSMGFYLLTFIYLDIFKRRKI